MTEPQIGSGSQRSAAGVGGGVDREGWVEGLSKKEKKENTQG